MHLKFSEIPLLLQQHDLGGNAGADLELCK